MTEIPGFVIYSPPRTKKTHSRIVTIAKKGSSRCRACGHMPGFPKLLPSSAYVEWEESALQQCVGIKLQLARAGVSLPVAGSVSIEAHIYRQANVGDAVGFYQAIGDMLQAAGILENDRQIEDWDGSRRNVDRHNPRVEVFITIINPIASQISLIDTEGASE